MIRVRAFILAGAIIVPYGTASADEYVNGYRRSNGTYVAPYERTSPNATPLDNYSTRGNVNPYTGQAGTRDPYAPHYDSGIGRGLLPDGRY